MRAHRLKTYLWVQIQQWQCKRHNLALYVTSKGDPNAGAVILKLNLMDGRCRVYTQIRDAEGRSAWQSRSADAEPIVEADADGYIAKQLDFDPDLWVIEIEDPMSLFELDGEVV